MNPLLRRPHRGLQGMMLKRSVRTIQGIWGLRAAPSSVGTVNTLINRVVAALWRVILTLMAAVTSMSLWTTGLLLKALVQLKTAQQKRQQRPQKKKPLNRLEEDINND